MMDRRGFLGALGAVAVAPSVSESTPTRAIPPIPAEEWPSTMCGTSSVELSLDNIQDAIRYGGAGGHLILHPEQALDLVSDLRRELHAAAPDDVPDAVRALFAIDFAAPQGPRPVYRGTVLGLPIWTSTAPTLINGGCDRLGWYVGPDCLIGLCSRA